MSSAAATSVSTNSLSAYNAAPSATYSRPPLDREKEIELGGKKIWLTHGHNYYVSLDLKVIEQEAVARGMDIVMFGHTHRPVIIVEDNITLINPGSISYPRQADGIPTYIILEINDNNEFNFELKNV